jgi:rod shape-determining protein MreD
LSNMDMNRWIVIGFFLLFGTILESSLFPWLIPLEFRDMLYPKIVLVAVIYIGCIGNRHLGVMYGFTFGLLQDVLFFGHMLGANAFAFALTGYVSGLFMRPSAIRMNQVLLIQASCLLLYEITLYSIYRLFDITNAKFGWLFVHGLMTSILMNLFIALSLYIPARRWLVYASYARDPEDHEKLGMSRIFEVKSRNGKG